MSCEAAQHEVFKKGFGGKLFTKSFPPMVVIARAIAQRTCGSSQLRAHGEKPTTKINIGGNEFDY